jgi:cation/acetate symporter
VAVAKSVWNREVGLAARSAGPRPHAQAFPGKDEAAQNTARLNFIGIVFCMMFGTAALPHILMRYYTTPSVQQARVSVFWSLFFIFLLYFTAPCLAVLAKYDMYSNLVGSSFASLPAWAAAWAKVDPGLLNITDINGDGIVQWAEVVIGGDLIVLATPEIAGLPYVVSGLVAAGGLAAALSTADGLLLTIANALSHDLYYKMIDPTASTTKRVTISKVLLVVVAIVAAYVTSLKPGDILFLVGAAFSLAASSFFPALVVGVFWKRANKWGAIVGMVAGLAICIYYMMRTYPFFTNMGVPKMDLWFGLSPVSAGMFGLPVGVLTIFIVSLLTSPPSKEVQELVEHVRYPHLKGDTVVSEAR